VGAQTFLSLLLPPLLMHPAVGIIGPGGKQRREILWGTPGGSAELRQLKARWQLGELNEKSLK